MALERPPGASGGEKGPVDEQRPQESTLYSVDKDENESHLFESFCVIPGELLEGSGFLPGDFFHRRQDG